MAQVNLTLSEQEVLQVITGNRDEALKFLLERILNELMRAESQEQLGASMSERTDSRTDYRNGTRERDLNTRIGKITLKVPRHRNEPFHTMVFDNYSRSEASLIAAMVQMVIAGVSTRKVEKVVQTLCGTSFSKSTVSKLCQKLDQEIYAFKNRSLDHMTAPFLMVDATYFNVKQDGIVVKKAVYIALGVTMTGEKEILGFYIGDSESAKYWTSILNELKNRGIKDILILCADGLKGLKEAIGTVYPTTEFQRCIVHMIRNTLQYVSYKDRKELARDLKQIYQKVNLL